MRRLLRWYGAGPLHLLAFLGCFALAGYAAARLVPSRPLGIAAWFLGAVIGHDLLLMPLYSLADASAAAAMRHRALQLPPIAWINYLRVPAALSGLLLLAWFPLILRLRTRYQASTTLSPSPFLWHWLAVTGALFLLSAALLALRVRTLRRAAAPPAPEPAPEPAPPRPLPPPPAASADLAGPAPDPDPHPPAAHSPSTIPADSPGAIPADSPGATPGDDADHAGHARNPGHRPD
jgi:hypothetical protein